MFLVVQVEIVINGYLLRFSYRGQLGCVGCVHRRALMDLFIIRSYLKIGYSHYPYPLPYCYQLPYNNRVRQNGQQVAPYIKHGKTEK